MVRLLLLIALLLQGPFAVAQSKPPMVVGYFPFWSIYSYQFHVPDVRGERLTHLIYQHAKVLPTGEVVLGDKYADLTATYPGDAQLNDPVRGSFGQLRRLKQQHPHLKTLISIGGWVWSDQFSQVAADPDKRQVFVRSALTFIRDYGFDGIELDWRYPQGGGNEAYQSLAVDGDHYLLLLQELRAAMNQLQASLQQPVLLSATAGVLPHLQGDYDKSQLMNSLDFVSLLSATMRGGWSKTTGHQAPLGPVENIAAVQHWLPELLAAGFDASKMVLGAPTTGIGWEGVPFTNLGIDQAYERLPYGSRDNEHAEPSGLFTYEQIAELAQLEDAQTHWDDQAQAHFLYVPSRELWLSYESPESLAAKLAYIDDMGLAGLSLSELSGDLLHGQSLLNAVHRHYFPWKSHLFDVQDWVSHHITLVSSIASALLALLLSLLVLRRWFKQQQSQRLWLQGQQQQQVLLADHLSMQRAISELFSALLTQRMAQACNKLIATQQQEMVEHQVQQLFLLQLSDQLASNRRPRPLPKALNLNTLALALGGHRLHEEELWVLGDIRALLYCLRIVMPLHPRVQRVGNRWELNCGCSPSDWMALTSQTEGFGISMHYDDGQLRLSLPIEPQDTHYLQYQPSKGQLNQQRLTILQKLQQTNLICTDIEQQFQDVLQMLKLDPKVEELVEGEHQDAMVRLNHGQLGLSLLVSESLDDEDRLFFQAVAQLLNLSRQTMEQLASSPQLLSELHEIASRKDRIFFIKAEDGYSGIYDKKRGNPRYILMRLKAIKLYFGDEVLLQCHRSWLVNPNRVQKAIRKNRLSYVLDLGHEQVPVGRSFVNLLKQSHPQWFDHLRA